MLRLVVVSILSVVISSAVWAQDPPAPVIVGPEPVTVKADVKNSGTINDDILDMVTNLADQAGRSVIILGGVELPSDMHAHSTDPGQLVAILRLAASQVRAIVEEQDALIIIRPMDAAEKKRELVTQTYSVIEPMRNAEGKITTAKRNADGKLT